MQLHLLFGIGSKTPLLLPGTHSPQAAQLRPVGMVGRFSRSARCPVLSWLANKGKRCGQVCVPYSQPARDSQTVLHRRPDSHLPGDGLVLWVSCFLAYSVPIVSTDAQSIDYTERQRTGWWHERSSPLAQDLLKGLALRARFRSQA